LARSANPSSYSTRDEGFRSESIDSYASDLIDLIALAYSLPPPIATAFNSFLKEFDKLAVSLYYKPNLPILSLDLFSKTFILYIYSQVSVLNNIYIIFLSQVLYIYSKTAVDTKIRGTRRARRGNERFPYIYAYCPAYYIHTIHVIKHIFKSTMYSQGKERDREVSVEAVALAAVKATQCIADLFSSEYLMAETKVDTYSLHINCILIAY